jgi:hypothetical protein
MRDGRCTMVVNYVTKRDSGSSSAELLRMAVWSQPSPYDNDLFAQGVPTKYIKFLTAFGYTST